MMSKAWYGPVETEEECTNEGRLEQISYMFAKPVDALCEEVGAV